MSNVNDALRDIQVLQEEVDLRMKNLRSEVIAEIQTMIDRFEIFSCELRFREPNNVPRQKVKPNFHSKVPMKYRGPNGQLWSGRGRTPLWVRQVEAQGGSRNEYLIEY